MNNNNNNRIISQNMSHRKVYSQGSIPFSWEDSPGISKAFHRQKCPNKEKKVVQNDTIPKSTSSTSPRSTTSFCGDSNTNSAQELKIPLPPCPQLSHRPRRSTSGKGFGWWQEDPFLAAYKECTREGKNFIGLLPGGDQSKRLAHGSKVIIRKSKTMFSCKKNSCDVDDNLVRLSSTLPPIPRDRVRGR